MHITKTEKNSTSWISVLDYRYLLKKGSTCILRKGNQINFWYDHWMDNSPSLATFKPNIDHLIVRYVKVSDFI